MVARQQVRLLTYGKTGLVHYSTYSPTIVLFTKRTTQQTRPGYCYMPLSLCVVRHHQSRSTIGYFYSYIYLKKLVRKIVEKNLLNTLIHEKICL